MRATQPLVRTLRAGVAAMDAGNAPPSLRDFAEDAIDDEEMDTGGAHLPVGWVS